MDFIFSYPIIASLFISFGINAFFFFFAATFKTDKLTDISYSLSFFLLTLLLLFASRRGLSYHQIIVASAIVLWSIRLGSYLLYRILKIGKDARFDDKRSHFVRFLKFWLLQATAVWVVMLPFSIFITAGPQAGSLPLTVIGAVVFTAGLLIESVSDIQKFRFKSTAGNKGRWVDTGLWKYSRHPNYFGELLVWWGLFVAVIPKLSGIEWLTIIGPLFISLLILFVSGIPLLEKSADNKFGDDPDYIRYRESTSILVPLPPRSRN